MRRHTVDAEVLGPWSLTTSRVFCEGFSPAALDHQRAGDGIRTVFRVEADWSRAEVEVTQRDHLATISVAGDGDLEAASDQVRRFLSLDVDARGGRTSTAATRSSPTRWIIYPGYVRAVSTHRTRPRPGRCCPNASASGKPLDFGATSSTATATRSIPGPTCSPRPRPRSARPQDRVPARRRRRGARGGASTVTHCEPSTRTTPSGRSKTSQARAVRGRAGGAPRRQRPRRPPPATSAPGHADRRALRHQPDAGKGLRGLAALPHLGGSAPARATRATHPPDRRPAASLTSPASNASPSTAPPVRMPRCLTGLRPVPTAPNRREARFRPRAPKRPLEGRAAGHGGFRSGTEYSGVVADPPSLSRRVRR